MTPHFPALGLILLFPALGFLFNLFLGRPHGAGRAVNLVGPGVIFVAFAVAVMGLRQAAVNARRQRRSPCTLWPWIRCRALPRRLRAAHRCAVGLMTLIVTGVGALIHVYSVGYMAHDEDYARFFTYLNLFELSMLILVLANNLLADVHGMGGRRALLLSADRVLVHQSENSPTTGARPSSPTASATRASCSACSRSSRRSARTVSGRSTFSTMQRQRRDDCSRRTALAAACCSLSAPPANPRRFRSTSGCPTRWSARPRSAR